MCQFGDDPFVLPQVEHQRLPGGIFFVFARVFVVVTGDELFGVVIGQPLQAVHLQAGAEAFVQDFFTDDVFGNGGAGVVVAGFFGFIEGGDDGLLALFVVIEGGELFAQLADVGHGVFVVMD